MTPALRALSYAADILDPRDDGPDHAAWCRAELPHIFTLPFGSLHLWLLGRFGRRPSGVRAFGGGPRGSGKTSTLFVGGALSAIALRTHRFIVVCGVTQEEAEARLRIIRHELKRNRALVRRWPALRFARPTAGETVDRNKEILLVGGRIVAVGAGAAIRGLLRETITGELVRPDLFLGDDLETAEQARSKLRTDRLEEWLFADVAQLGANVSNPFAARMDVIVIGTTLDTDALATRAIQNKGRFASWQTAAFPAETRDDQGGRVATWPAGQPLELLDALLDPTSETFIGELTYAREYLLDPRERAASLVKRAAIIRGKVPRRQDGRVDLRFISFGLDPAATERAHERNDFSAIVGAGLDRLDRVWIFTAWRGQVSSDRVFDILAELTDALPGSAAAYEAIGGFAWGVKELRRRGIPHRAVTSGADKVSEFQPVALLYESNLKGVPAIIHDESLAETTFEAELLAFPTGEHDDYVDAERHAVKMATGAFRRRAREAART